MQMGGGLYKGWEVYEKGRGEVYEKREGWGGKVGTSRVTRCIF